VHGSVATFWVPRQAQPPWVRPRACCRRWHARSPARSPWPGARPAFARCPCRLRWSAAFSHRTAWMWKC